jgi:hypothetical protein
MRVLLLLLALPLWAAEDANAIVRRLVEAEHGNRDRVSQFTYTEETRRFDFRKNGEPHLRLTETHEVIFVEGLEYRKLVARDGKPLSTREQAQVEKDMAQTAAERRKHVQPTPPGGVMTLHGTFRSRSMDFGSSAELLTLFDNRIEAEETLRGHQTWVLGCTPRANYLPANEHEKQVLVFRKKLWLDQAEGMPVRGQYTVLGEGGFAQPGSTVTFDFDKVDSDTWHLISIMLDIAMEKQPVFHPTARTEYRMSNFHKFDVQSTITVHP